MEIGLTKNGGDSACPLRSNGETNSKPDVEQNACVECLNHHIIERR